MILGALGTGQQERFEEQRQLNHELATWVAFAFHDPKKIPKYKPLKRRGRAPAGKPPAASQELQHAQVRGYFIGLAMRRGPMERT